MMDGKPGGIGSDSKEGGGEERGLSQTVAATCNRRVGGNHSNDEKNILHSGLTLGL